MFFEKIDTRSTRQNTLQKAKEDRIARERDRKKSEEIVKIKGLMKKWVSSFQSSKELRHLFRKKLDAVNILSKGLKSKNMNFHIPVATLTDLLRLYVFSKSCSGDDFLNLAALVPDQPDLNSALLSMYLLTSYNISLTAIVKAPGVVKNDSLDTMWRTLRGEFTRVLVYAPQIRKNFTSSFLFSVVSKSLTQLAATRSQSPYLFDAFDVFSIIVSSSSGVKSNPSTKLFTIFSNDGMTDVLSKISNPSSILNLICDSLLDSSDYLFSLSKSDVYEAHSVIPRIRSFFLLENMMFLYQSSKSCKNLLNQNSFLESLSILSENIPISFDAEFTKEISKGNQLSVLQSLNSPTESLNVLSTECNMRTVLGLQQAQNLRDLTEKQLRNSVDPVPWNEAISKLYSAALGSFRAPQLSSSDMKLENPFSSAAYGLKSVSYSKQLHAKHFQDSGTSSLSSFTDIGLGTKGRTAASPSSSVLQSNKQSQSPNLSSNSFFPSGSKYAPAARITQRRADTEYAIMDILRLEKASDRQLESGSTSSRVYSLCSVLGSCLLNMAPSIVSPPSRLDDNFSNIDINEQELFTKSLRSALIIASRLFFVLPPSQSRLLCHRLSTVVMTSSLFPFFLSTLLDIIATSNFSNVGTVLSSSNNHASVPGAEIRVVPLESTFLSFSAVLIECCLGALDDEDICYPFVGSPLSETFVDRVSTDDRMLLIPLLQRTQSFYKSQLISLFWTHKAACTRASRRFLPEIVLMRSASSLYSTLHSRHVRMQSLAVGSSIQSGSPQDQGSVSQSPMIALKFTPDRATTTDTSVNPFLNSNFNLINTDDASLNALDAPVRSRADGRSPWSAGAFLWGCISAVDVSESILMGFDEAGKDGNHHLEALGAREADSSTSFRLQLVLQTMPFVVQFKLRLELLDALRAREQAAYQSERMALLHAAHMVPISERVQVVVRRNHLLQDARGGFDSEKKRLGLSALKKRLYVTFINSDGLPEAGIDGGGLVKEFIDAVVKEGFKGQKKVPLFTETKDARSYPNPYVFQAASLADSSDDDMDQDADADMRYSVSDDDSIDEESDEDMDQTGFGSGRGFFEGFFSSFTQRPPHAVQHRQQEDSPLKYLKKPLKASTPEEDILNDYLFLGNVIGKALLDNILCEPRLAPFVLSKMLGGNVNSPDELISLDPDLYRHLRWLRQQARTYRKAFLRRSHGAASSSDGSHSASGELNEVESSSVLKDPVEDLCLTFDVLAPPSTIGGPEKIVPLGGKAPQTPVTSWNVDEYAMRLAQYRLNTQIDRQVTYFLRGLQEVIPPVWLRMFSPLELQVLLSGCLWEDESINISELQESATYSGYSEDSRVVQWFWEVLKELDKDQQAKLLSFVTSVSRPPLRGFKSLEPRFGIVRADGGDQKLPTSQTCFNLLKLPVYSSKETLKEKLLVAINSAAGFELS